MTRAPVIAAVFACGLGSATVAVADNPKIGQVGWLAGRWQTVHAPSKPGAKAIRVNEEWYPTPDGTMMSWGVTVKGDTLVDSETVIIRESGPYLLYEAHPMGQEKAVFHSITITENSIVFENLAHDFPQRVGYQLVGPDSLMAWIEGPRNGKMKRIEFPYQRVKSSQ